MVDFNTIILQFAEQGEKTGWTYIEIPADVAQEMKPGNKKSFRVKGKLDEFEVRGMALMPMGDGNFIMALRREICKAIHKHRGAMLRVRLEPDDDFKYVIPDDLLECLEYEPEGGEFFNSLAESHRGYFIKWIESAKTEATRANRIASTVNAMVRRMDYGQMLRAQKKRGNKYKCIVMTIPPFKLNGRIWLEIDEEKILGHGRVELLERIHASGSIRQAALQMKMSYKQAWDLVNHINDGFKQPLVISKRGGKGGGVALLTPFGQEVIKEFRELQLKFFQFLEVNGKT